MTQIHWTKRYRKLAFHLYRIKGIISNALIFLLIIAPAILIALVWR